MRRLAILALAQCLALCQLRAQPGYQNRVLYELPAGANTQPAARVAELIGQLSSSAISLRQGAWQALLAMGPSVEPQLQHAWNTEQSAVPWEQSSTTPPRYTYAALNSLLHHIGEQRRTAASRVTLQHSNAPLADILRDFGAQIDAAVSISSIPDARFTGFELVPGSINVQSVSYWDALRAIRQSLGLTPTLSARGAVALYRRQYAQSEVFPLDDARAVAAGPALLAVTASQRDGSGIQLNLEAIAEPRTGAGRYAIVRVEQYEDDTGLSLLNGGAAREFLSDTSRLALWGWRIPLQLPSPPTGRAIGRLKGQLGISTGPPGLDIIVIDLRQTNGRQFEYEGIAIEVKGNTQSGDGYLVTGDLSAPVASPLGAAIENLQVAPASGGVARDQLERLALADADGRWIWRDIEAGAARREGDRVVLSWTLRTRDTPARILNSAPPAPQNCRGVCVPAALSWSTPVDTRWLWIPFELRGIPLERDWQRAQIR